MRFIDRIIIIFALIVVGFLILQEENVDLYQQKETEIPNKAYTKIGLDYFCTIEFVKPTIINELKEKYGHEISYELIRFNAYLLIDSKNKDEWFDSDTIIHKGMKIYDIEEYTFDEYIEKMSSLYEE